MTHPITPPSELVQQWADMLATYTDTEVFSAAAQWGADQELEACCALMDDWGLEASDLRAERRPKPPSLKERAYAAIDRIERSGYPTDDLYTLRRALEALND